MKNEASGVQADAPAGRILVVEDEDVTRENLASVLARAGHVVETASDGAAALSRIGEAEYDLVVTDLKMPGADGLAVLSAARKAHPETEVIILTGYATVETALSALKAGAYDYVTKPFNLDEVRVLVQRALEKNALKRENRRLRGELEQRTEWEGLIGASPAMREVFSLIERVAETDATVLLTGETGTGKELVARAIHKRSARREGPFVPVNCGALSEELLANELFGHEKDAFTGATSTKAGLFETASGGTLFLDEVSEMAPRMQIKFLRVLQEKAVYRVGGTRSIPTDVRVVSATNRDLGRAVANRLFRADLYYRLNVVRIHLPPLCDRRTDVPLLVAHFIGKYARAFSRKVEGIEADAMALLIEYDFPGNVRELENIVERAVALERGERLTVASLPPELASLKVRTHRPAEKDLSRRRTLEEMERDAVEQALTETGFRRNAAAILLGIDRTTLWRKIKKYEIPIPEGAEEAAPAEEDRPAA